MISILSYFWSCAKLDLPNRVEKVPWKSKFDTKYHWLISVSDFCIRIPSPPPYPHTHGTWVMLLVIVRKIFSFPTVTRIGKISSKKSLVSVWLTLIALLTWTISENENSYHIFVCAMYMLGVLGGGGLFFIQVVTKCVLNFSLCVCLLTWASARVV